MSEMAIDRNTLPIGPLDLSGGARLDAVEVAYEMYGHLSPAGDNALLVCHALTGSASAGGDGGWWGPLIGPGRAIDTDRFAVICPNFLGSCYGTTGPASTNPATGAPYGPGFPFITVGDMVAAQQALLAQLGVTRLACVAGGSLGGLQVLEWAARAPAMIDAIIPIATALAHAPWQIAFNEVARQAIRNDPAWLGGRYTEQPLQGLSLARMVAMISYRAAPSFDTRFGRQRRTAGGEPGRFEVEHYLHYQGEKLVGRFDANCYLCITEAMDAFDVGETRGGAAEALAPFRGPALVLGIDSDVLYPLAQQHDIVSTLRHNGNEATYAEIASPHGHDSFLIEWDQLATSIGPFLAGLG